MCITQSDHGPFKKKQQDFPDVLILAAVTCSAPTSSRTQQEEEAGPAPKLVINHWYCLPEEFTIPTGRESIDVENRLKQFKSMKIKCASTLHHIHTLLNSRMFHKDRYMWVTKMCKVKPRRNIINVWSSEEAAFTVHYGVIQQTTQTSICNSAGCPVRNKWLNYKEIILTRWVFIQIIS